MRYQKNTLFRTCILSILLFSLENPSFAQTQQEMTRNVHEKMIQSESHLDSLYKVILEYHATDTLFIRNFEQAQKAWREYVSREMALLLPEYYGSYALCSLSITNQYVEARIEHLKQWTDGIEEGDVCTGSRELKSPETLLNIEILSSTKEACEKELLEKERIHGIQIGNSYTDLILNLGKPDTTYAYLGPNEELFVNWVYKEKGMELVFFVDYHSNGAVSLVDATCTNPTFTTGLQVKVGDSFETFQNAYKKIIEVYYDKSTLKSLTKKDAFKITLGNDSGIEFEFENGKVTVIFLSNYWGPWC